MSAETTGSAADSREVAARPVRSDDSGPGPGRPRVVLVLAGRRSSADPLAAADGAVHRALLDIEGEPMLQRVVEMLLAEGRFERVIVSIDQPDLLECHPKLVRRVESGELLVLKSEDSPSLSVLAGLDVSGAPPVLVTTADHALLDGEMLDHFLGESSASGADLTIGLVPRTAIEQRFPETKRTYLHFRNESYSGANLFAFRTDAARRAAEFWRRAERHRKHPWKLVRSFGWLSLFLFVTRRLDLASAMNRAGQTLGITVHAVEMPMAEAAVDVDKIEDLELVRRILAERRRT